MLEGVGDRKPSDVAEEFLRHLTGGGQEVDGLNYVVDSGEDSDYNPNLEKLPVEDDWF